MKKLFPILALSLLCAASAKVQAATTYLTGTFYYDGGAASSNSTLVATVGFDSGYYDTVFSPTLSNARYIGIYFGDPGVTSLSYTINNSALPGMDGNYNVDLGQSGNLLVADILNSNDISAPRFTFWDPAGNLEAVFYGVVHTYGANATYYTMTSSTSSVPEPSTYGLIGLGALGVAMLARRKKTA